MTVLIIAHNAKTTCEKTLLSLLSQTASYKVLFIDDGSTDATFSLAQKISDLFPKDSFRAIRYEEHKGSPTRLYETAATLPGDELIVFFEADSFLKKDALKEIYNLFTEKDVWLGCFGTNVLSYPNQLFGASMRGKRWERVYLKASYAGLIQKLSPSSLFFKGKTIEESEDISYMFPLLEMSSSHVVLSPKTLIETTNKKSSHSIKFLRTIHSATPRKPLQIHPAIAYFPLKHASLVVFSYNRPIQLFALLESVEKRVKGLEETYILYRADPPYKEAYDTVKKRFPSISFIQQKTPPSDFHRLTLNILREIRSNYLLFAVDDLIVTDEINLSSCIEKMEKTKGYFFSLRLGKNISYNYMANKKESFPAHIQIDPDTYAYAIDSAEGDFNYFHSVDLTIYRKTAVKNILGKISFQNPNDLENTWKKFPPKHLKRSIGLCYGHSKCVNLPLNLVNPSTNRNMHSFTPEELLSLFSSHKIDIEALYKLDNPSVHMDLNPSFITWEDTEKSSLFAN